MSDQPKKKIELRELLVAVMNVTDWYGLGVHLSLPRHMLDKIKAERLPVEDSMREMLKKWLDDDPEASWEKLASAFEAMDKRAVAESVRSRGSGQAVAMRSSSQQVVQVGPVAAARNYEDEPETRVILGKIKTSFSLLVTKVRLAIQASKVDISEVREFLITYHEGECDIPNVKDLMKIFESVTKAKLWRYDHYSLLENLAESFIPDDDPARDKMTEYLHQLTAFYTTTSIIDFLKASDQEDPEDDGHPISPKRYNRRYRKLTVKVKVDPSVPMEYVEKLWKALMKEFNLPPLSAIIDKMEEGSLTITWLILPHIKKKIRATYFKSVDFFKHHNIIEFKFGRLTLYDEQWMKGSTPLYRASYAGNIEKVRTLLHNGTEDINQHNDNADGDTPLIGASLASGDVEIVRLLLEKGAGIDVQNMIGESALMMASEYGHTDVVILLLEYKADVNLCDDSENTALISACAFGNTDTVTLLLAHGAVVNHRDMSGATSALIYASMIGNTDTVKVLVQHGARLDLATDEGVTALMAASGYGHVGIARILLENGATVDIKDIYGCTALWWASSKDYPETVKILLEFGAEVDLPCDYERGTALTVASQEGRTQIVRILLSHGALVDYQDKNGQTPLHHASVRGHVDTVKILLEKGAKVDLHNEDGWTALFLAATQDQDNVVKTLLDHGAAVDIKTESGLTALDIARALFHQAVCEVIEQHLNQGAKVEPQQTGGQEDSESQDQVGESGQDSKTELTEEQRSEVRSVGERLWYQFKRVFLRDLTEKKERTGQLQGDPSPRITNQPKGRRSILNLLNWSRRRRPVEGTAPVPEHR